MSKKVKKATVTIVAEEPRTFWQKVKNFFYNSHNVFWNWVQGAIGTITAAAIGIFGGVDWGYLGSMLKSGTMFTKEQWFLVGGGLLVSAIAGYATRVVGTKEVNGHLLPKAD